MAAFEAIQHIVVLMMENRSFDHYLGALNFDSRYPNREQVNGLRQNRRVNRALDGRVVPIASLDGQTLNIADPPHEWPEVAQQFNDANLDGFVTTYERFWIQKKHPLEREMADRVMGYYTRTTLPVLYALADQFAVCDAWFSSFLGSTWPNRLFLHAGACGDTMVTGKDAVFSKRPLPVWASWEKAGETGEGLTWKVYVADWSTFLLWPWFAAKHGGRGACLPEFRRDCAHETLPQVAIIEPPYTIADDHPPHQPQRGELLIKYVVESLIGSRSWDHSALIITYDEHGGFFDHVEPPEAPDASSDPRLHRLGFRVPTIVASPFTPASRVVRERFDHTAILRTIADRWGLQAPGSRAPLMRSIWDSCFDFAAQPRAGDSIILPNPAELLRPKAFNPLEHEPPTDLEEAFQALAELTRSENPEAWLQVLDEECLFPTLREIPALRRDFDPGT